MKHSSPAPNPYCPDYLVCQFHMTNQCNGRCLHCYQNDYTDNDASLDSLLFMVHQIRDLIDTCRTLSGRRSFKAHLTLTGGEPFLHPELMQLVEIISGFREVCSFSILTNGTLITPALAARLRTYGPAYVQVSVEGDRRTHDHIRGQGAYDAAMSGIRNLKKHRIPVSISFSAHRKNYTCFPDVVRACTRLKVDRIWADRFVPLGDGPDQMNWVLGRAHTRTFFHTMYREQQRNRRSWFRKSRVAMHRALQFLEGGGKPYACTAGACLITIMPNGDVYPCRRMPVSVGNVHETVLSQIYLASPFLRTLRDKQRVPDECMTCFYAPYCRGGLRCLSRAVTGDPFTRDPDCYIL